MFSNLTAALTNEFKVLYSANRQDYNFQELVTKMTSYDGPTFVLVKTVNKESINIFGGFKMQGWKVDGENYQGDEQTYVFSLYPKCSNYFYADSETSLPFFNYLNLSKDGLKNGIGFGGSLNKNTFRIWIDRETLKGSYTINEDITFESGYLVEPGNETLNVNNILIDYLIKGFYIDCLCRGFGIRKT